VLGYLAEVNVTMSGATAPSPQTLVTGDELARTPNLGRCELVEGRVIDMSPTGYEHGRIEARFAAILQQFVLPKKLGHVLTGEVGIFTRRNPDTVRGADVLYISNERFARKTPGRAFLDVAPELVVEVLSPDDRPGEVLRKLGEYFDAGVLLVWLADPEERVVMAHRSLTDVRRFAISDSLSGDDVLPGFTVPLSEIFGS
jgi:Uma2 family endonuclease